MEMKMATSKDFVDAVVNKNNLEAEDAFKAAIQTKVGDALEAKRKEVANTFVVSPSSTAKTAPTKAGSFPKDGT